LEIMERLGIVSAPREGGMRDVLVAPEEGMRLLDARTNAVATPSQQESAPQAAQSTPDLRERPPAVGHTSLPQRRRTGAGDESEIAQAASRRAQSTRTADRTDATQAALAAQAHRMRAKAEFTRQAATTPAEGRRA